MTSPTAPGRTLHRGTVRLAPAPVSARRAWCADDEPVVVMRDVFPPYEPCFHFLRRDVVLGTVYWDDGAPCGPNPARPPGWFAVVTGSDTHDWAEVDDGPAMWRAAIRSAHRYLAARGGLRSTLTSAQSRAELFFQPGAVELEPVEIRLS